MRENVALFPPIDTFRFFPNAFLVPFSPREERCPSMPTLATFNTTGEIRPNADPSKRIWASP